ncbi:hypothetical protein J31TS4_40860 [Paenibacillus sp. J31TS4]|uniref:LarC family nickel insertion protein n=1 Tax=Paenibacillus sp. J31TS4 TaxID=2807195 RepID=UPI001B1F9270|nr:LarC family nickel insertion protein [Paenibacillus sp. J31TS4]GIP40806.1 hypothetical protein J31TS4_40860 [Paenibacillus sp. J31TS4]
MKIAYFDCFSGISGDMALAALVDAGADRHYIEEELARIPFEPFSLSWKRVNKRGISSLKMDVLQDEHDKPHHHRHYADIVKMIRSAGFSKRTTELSLAIFEKIGIAEGKIHGIPLEKVHFHEVGAIDSIADVIGVALALDSLELERIYCSPVALGNGMIHIDHGHYPVPAPATLEMMIGLPVAASPYRKELTTPTGAGIVSAVVDKFLPGLPNMTVEAVGYGAGTRDLPDQPNVLRVVIGRADPSFPADHVRQLLPIHEHVHEHSHDHDHPHHHHHGHDHEHEHGHHHSHDHDHEHGHHHGHDHDHEHGHHHGHEHEHEHEHEHHRSQEHGHRSDEKEASLPHGMEADREQSAPPGPKH